MRIEAFRLIWIVGAGGHATVVCDALRAQGWQGEIGLRDDDMAKWGMSIMEVPVMGPAVPEQFDPDVGVHVAIGSNEVRLRLLEQTVARGGAVATIVHPAATISNWSTVEQGVFVAAGARIGPGAKVGFGAIINHNAVVDHDCKVGQGVHVAPGAILGGGAIIEDAVLIGSSATVLPGVRIGAFSRIGAGSVVVRNVAGRSVMVGVPARKRP